MRNRKPKTFFGQALLLIIFAVLFSALFNHIDKLGDLLWFVADLLEPLVVGLVLAFLMNVPMRGLERLFAKLQTKAKKPITEKRNAMASLILTYILVPLMFALVFYAIIPEVISTIPGVISSIEGAWPRFIEFLQSYNIDTSTLESLLLEIDLTALLKTVADNLGTIVETGVSAVSSVVTGLTIGITGVVISVYVLANKRKLSQQIRKLLYAYTGRKFADKTVEVARLTNETFANFLAGQCLEAVILGVMFFLVMTILGMPFALVISVFLAFTSLIPYVGAILGFALGFFLILTVSPMQALVYLIVSVVVQQVENQVIYPKVVGTSVGLSPLWILVSVFVGGKLFGLLGMMFFIPFVAVGYSLLRVNMMDRLKKRKLKVDSDGVHDTDDPPESPEDPEKTPEAPEAPETPKKKKKK